MDNFTWKDIVDILLVATVMYQVYRVVSKSGTGVIFNGGFGFYHYLDIGFTGFRDAPDGSYSR